MKRSKWHLPLLTVVATGSLVGVALVLAGPLDPPPGSVTPTYKTLSDVEPRIAIRQSMIPLNITDRGSYYLAENITFNAVSGNPITIQIGGGTRVTVSIDLNGFEIRQVGTPTNTQGIRIAGDDQGGSTIIRNGFITGFSRGIDHSAYGLIVENVGFGANNVGIYTGGGTTISKCSFHRGAYGVFVDNQTQAQTYQGGCIVSNCAAKLVTNGFYGGNGTTFTDCEVNDFFGRGFEVFANCTVRNCGAYGGSQGIVALTGNVITGNRISGHLAEGILITTGGTANRIESNTITGAGNAGQVGLRILGPRNTVRDNLVQGTPNNYDFAAGNQLDLVLTQIPESIDWPANVRLAGSLTGISGQNGITVASDNVAIDLNGHALIGVAGSGSGISPSGVRSGFSLRNGVVRGWGNGGVILFNGVTNAIANFNVTNVQAVSNIDEGFFVGNNGQMENCVGSNNTREGFIVLENVTVAGCTAAGNTLGGFIAKTACGFDRCIARSNGAGFSLAGSPGGRLTYTNCQAIGNAGDGITTADGCELTGCLVADNTGIGINLGSGNTVQSTTVRSNILGGIRVPSACRIVGNNISGNNAGAGNQDGVQVNGQRNLIEGNSFSFEDNGLNVLGTSNHIAKNTFSSANAFVASGNSYGPFINVVGVNDITGTAGSNHPQANFVY